MTKKKSEWENTIRRKVRRNQGTEVGLGGQESRDVEKKKKEERQEEILSLAVSPN